MFFRQDLGGTEAATSAKEAHKKCIGLVQKRWAQMRSARGRRALQSPPPQVGQGTGKHGTLSAQNRKGQSFADG